MFIKLYNVPTDIETVPKPSWVNADHIVEVFTGEKRQFATVQGNRILQNPTPCTYICINNGMDNSLYVLETPEQIMALLNGAQMHGASA